jgi:DNA repair protein RadC
MKIKDLPFYNRPGFKLTKNGVSSLDNAELLSIIFGVGNEKESALELSNRVLKKYNLNKLEHLGLDELKKECGNDLIKAIKIMSLIELSKRYNKLVKGGYNESIRSSKDVFNIFNNELSNLKKEKAVALYLDTRNKIIKKEVLSIGILDGSLVHPRELFNIALKESAKSVILVHNHPSGDCNPSEEDCNLTKSLIQAGNLVGICFLDHIIVGKNCFYSFKDDRIIRV